MLHCADHTPGEFIKHRFGGEPPKKRSTVWGSSACTPRGMEPGKSAATRNLVITSLTRGLLQIMESYHLADDWVAMYIMDIVRTLSLK